MHFLRIKSSKRDEIHPLEELNWHIFNFVKGSVFFVVNVFFVCECARFHDNHGEQSVNVFHMVPCRHKGVACVNTFVLFPGTLWKYSLGQDGGRPYVFV